MKLVIERREGGVAISKWRQFVLRRSIPDLNSALESYEVDLLQNKILNRFDFLRLEQSSIE